MATNKDDGMLCAVLAWIFPIGLIWWLVDEKMKNNSLAKFHVKQNLVWVIAGFIISIAFSILSVIIGIIAIIPVIGWIIGIVWAIVAFVFWILFIVLWIMGLVYAFQKKEKMIPVIGKFAKKLTF